jgi:hypothetical protein
METPHAAGITQTQRIIILIPKKKVESHQKHKHVAILSITQIIEKSLNRI